MSGTTKLGSPEDPAVAADKSGNLAQARRLSLLQHIAWTGGLLTPFPDPHALHGYAYSVRDDRMAEDVNFLVRHNYLEQRFFDRVSLCPKCDSHHLNVREICPSCRRAHLANEGMLHHFRCGYVGIPSEFATGKDGSYVCPKCNGEMHRLGTEYDRLGKAHLCRGCGIISENPPVEAVCLACGTRTPAESLVSTNVYSFVLTSRGASANRSGSLLEADQQDDEICIVGAPVYGRKITLEFLDQEAKRLQHFKRSFSVLLVRHLPPPDDKHSAPPTEWLNRLRRNLREIDLLGQVADLLYVVLMPHTNHRSAEAVRQQIEADLGTTSPLTVSIAEIREARQLHQLLAGVGVLP